MSDNTFNFSERTQWPEGVNALSQAVEKLRAQKIEIADLTESNPTRCGFEYPTEKILTSLNRKENLTYAPDPRGLFQARKAVRDYYKSQGRAVTPEQIFLTASTSEGYSYLFRLLANPGDRILFPRPSYPLFQFLVDLNDVVMDAYTLEYDNQWKVDGDSVKAAANPRTKALAFVNPNNPTGSYIKSGEVKMLNDICRQNGWALICDEVFFDFPFDDKAGHPSFVTNQEVLTFTLGGLSKTMALPQMKLSWIIVSGPAQAAAQAQARLEIISDTYLSVNTPVQNAAASWLADKDTIQDQIRQRTRQNLDTLRRLTSGRTDCRVLDVEGGWYAVLKIPAVLSEEEWCLDFLDKDHVFVHPGYFFDFEDEGYIVISLLPAESIFLQAVEKIIKRIEKTALQGKTL